MPEAMATARPRDARPCWWWSGAAEIIWPEPVEENLEAVLNLLPTSRSSREDLRGELASLGARHGRYLHQDEHGPARAAQMVALREFLSASKALSSCLAELPEALCQLMSRQLPLLDDYSVITNHDIGLTQAYENDCKAVELIALVIADIEGHLRRSRSETVTSAQAVSEATERAIWLVHALDTSTEGQIATFSAAPSLAVDNDADAFCLVRARIQRLQRLIELPLARLEPMRGPEKRISLRWLVRELCGIWERETRQTVTSSGVKALTYDGIPRSPAGRFVLAAVNALCPSPRDIGEDEAVRALFTDQTVHGAIQEYVRDHLPATGRRRGRPRRGCATI